MQNRTGLRKQIENTQVYAFSYSYDTAHNRLTMRREGSTVGTDFESAYYAYANDNSMTKKRVYTAPSTFVDTYFYYDNNGARTAAVEGGSPTYFGYGANKLPTVIAPPGIAATYFYYDALLNRYCINNAGTPTYYLWEGLKLLEERDASGTLLARFTHGYSRLSDIGTIVEVQRNTGGTTYYQFPIMDHRGTVYALSDGAVPALQQTYTLDAFGRALAPVGGTFPAIPNEFISQTNAMTLQIGGAWYLLFKYRLLRIDEGAFLSRDFLRYLNKYRAWSNNPVGQVDRDGLEDADGGENEYPNDDPDLPNGYYSSKKLRWLRQKLIASIKDDVNNFKKKYGVSTRTAAKKYCVPAELLAAIIFNEIKTESLASKVAGVVGADKSIGLAQIRLDTAKTFNLIPEGKDSRTYLSGDDENIDAAANLLKQYLEKLSNTKSSDFSNGFWYDIARDSATKTNLKDGEFKSCIPKDREKDCDSIVNLNVSRQLIRSMAAIWNNGLSIIGIKDIKTAPNAATQAGNASALDDLFLDIGK